MTHVQLDLGIPGHPPALPPIRRRTAEISPCGHYRYRLTREWEEGRPPATFVMLNPSTADADLDDQTIRKCIRYARGWQCGSLVVVNLYAYRSTDPKALPAGAEAIGPDNDARLSEAALYALETGGPLVGGWGVHANPQRIADVLTLPGMERLTALAVTKRGQPCHPLYLSGFLTPQPWTAPKGIA